MLNVQKEIYEEILKMPVIDTHEHLPYSDDDREKNTDILKEYLSHYMSSDIKSAGMKALDFNRVIDTGKPLVERWKLVEPYWEVCRYTGYGRALDIAVQAIYGIGKVCGSTIEALDEAFQKTLVPGHFQHVLKELSGIRISLLDGFTGRFECDRTLFRRVWRPEKYIMPEIYKGNVIEWIEQVYGISVRTLDDWIEAFDKEFRDALGSGVVALKCGLAYQRSLQFNKVDYAVARNTFAGDLDKWNRNGYQTGDSLNFSKEVQDYMMHHILHASNKEHMTFQFHTGLQEGNGNDIRNSDPSLLTELFFLYPDVDFDLFHISYPFQGIAAVLCKNFPNVFIDMCWAHIISPYASRQSLNDFLDTVPYNKISAFGGDYLFVDGVYGHLYLARQNISSVLAQKVEEGVFSAEKAIDIAQALLYKNPIRIFKLAGEISDL